MASYIRKSEYAARHNVSPAYITKLIRLGRVVLDEAGKLVDVEASDRLMAESRDPSKQGVRDRFAAYRGDTAPAQAAPYGRPSSGATKPPEVFDFQEARAKRETHLANIAELDEKTKLGELLDKTDVRRGVADAAAAVRLALERVPDRLAPALAAETDQHAIYQMVAAAMDEVCEEMGRTIRAMMMGQGETRQ